VIREVSTVAAGLRENLFQSTAHHRRLESFSIQYSPRGRIRWVGADPEWYASNQKKTFD